MTRQNDYQTRRIAAGLCPHCGQKTDINPHTDKPYRLCQARREYLAARYVPKPKKGNTK